MLEALKFVRGAVARKNFQPALTHFRISGGRVMGFNGVIALSSPIDLDLEATPKADPFVKAIERCETTTAIHMTAAGKLSLRSGKFKAYIDCVSEEESEVLDAIRPEGVGAEVPGVIVEGLRTLEPYIGIDASRPWATGILLRERSAYATNNIILAEYWLGQEVPEMNLPSAAVRELLRIKEEPSAVTLGENSVTFHFEGDRWMRSQLLDTSWPDVGPVLSLPGDPTPIPPGLFDAVETIKPFVEDEGRIYFRDGAVSTSREEGAGASLEVEGVPDHGAFHFEHLLSLRDVAHTISFDNHPQPCPFKGENIRGVILGMVDA